MELHNLRFGTCPLSLERNIIKNASVINAFRVIIRIHRVLWKLLFRNIVSINFRNFFFKRLLKLGETWDYFLGGSNFEVRISGSKCQSPNCPTWQAVAVCRVWQDRDDKMWCISPSYVMPDVLIKTPGIEEDWDAAMQITLYSLHQSDIHLWVWRRIPCWRHVTQVLLPYRFE